MVRLLLLYNLTVFLVTQTTNVDIFYFLLSFLVFALLHRTCYIDKKYCFLLRIFKQQIWSSVSAIYSCSNLFPLQHLTIAFNHFSFSPDFQYTILYLQVAGHCQSRILVVIRSANCHIVFYILFQQFFCSSLVDVELSPSPVA